MYNILRLEYRIVIKIENISIKHINENENLL